MSVRKGNQVIAGGNSITIDSAISATSPNPVQNKAIAIAVNAINDTLENFDAGTLS